MRKVIHGISTAFGVVAALCIAAVMFSTAADVIVRQVTGSSIPGVVEYSEVLLVALVFLGLAYAQRVKAHIGVDIVTDRLRPRVSHVVRAVGLVLAILVLAWMTYETAMVAVHAFEVREYRFGLVQVPIWPVRIVVPVGLAVLILELVLSTYDEIVGARTGAPPTHAAHPEAATLVTDDGKGTAS